MREDGCTHFGNNIMRISTKIILCGLALSFAFLEAAQADDLAGPGYTTLSVVDNNALSDARGVIGVNLAAGDFNVQLNATAISLSNARGKGIAGINSFQSVGANQGVAPDVALINIHGNAFANARGLIRINQASGIANAQANGIAIAYGINAEVLAENELAQTVSTVGLRLTTESGRKGVRSISIDDTAFRGARGIIQVNQSAGSGNATANSFALRFQIEGGS